MTTNKQKSAVHFCEKWLHIDFTGNIDNRDEVNEFLLEHLEDAKMNYEEIRSGYETYLLELD